MSEQQNESAATKSEDANKPNKIVYAARLARKSLIAELTPLQFARRTGKQVSIPLVKREADELYNDMNAHFYAWTGQNLHGYTPE